MKYFLALVGLIVVALGVAQLAYAASWTTVAPVHVIFGTDGTDPQPMRTDANGNQTTVGTVASGATDSGNPVKVGGVYNSTMPTLTNGQRGDAQLDANGNVAVSLRGLSASGADGTTNTMVWALRSTGHVNNGLLATGGSSFNGSTWDRAFTCPSSAVINVSAGSTTQLVALASSQIIRVCSFVISGDTLATTATFVYGTGANCGSGTTSITGAMQLPDEGSIALSGMNGSLFRTIASNALCLTAATGAVTGFVTYAQY